MIPIAVMTSDRKGLEWFNSILKYDPHFAAWPWLPEDARSDCALFARVCQAIAAELCIVQASPGKAIGVDGQGASMLFDSAAQRGLIRRKD